MKERFERSEEEDGMLGPSDEDLRGGRGFAEGDESGALDEEIVDGEESGDVEDDEEMW